MIEESLSSDLVSVLNSMSVPIHIIDRDFRIVLFNDAFKKWSRAHGFDSIVIGKKLVDVFPFVSDRPVKEYTEVFKTGKVMVIENRTSTRTSDHYNIHRIPIFAKGSSEVTHIVTIIQDVTEAFETIDALHQSEQRYRSLVHLAGEGIWVTDKRDKTILVNPAMLKMLGYTEEEMLGRNVSDFLSRESKEAFETVARERISEEIPYSKYELIFRRKDGSIIHTRVAGSALYEQNKLIGSFGVISDISAEKEFQQMRDRFLGVTAHELRNPLAIISGYVEVLRTMTNKDESIQDLCDGIDKNIYRLHNLIQSVHDLAAIRANVFRINPTDVDLDKFIIQFKSQIQLLFPDRVIYLDNQIVNDIKSLRFDVDRMHQVLENLVHNAVKNSAEDKPVSVIFSIKESSEQLYVSVQDSGVGIPLLHLFQLFQPFSHLPTAYSHKGTGLGLYIVKSIISAHKGKLEVMTRENHGSQFTITIPFYTEIPKILEE